MDNDTIGYIAEYRASAAACTACTPGHTCIEHTCIDCLDNHAPAAPCAVDMKGR